MDQFKSFMSEDEFDKLMNWLKDNSFNKANISEDEFINTIGEGYLNTINNNNKVYITVNRYNSYGILCILKMSSKNRESHSFKSLSELKQIYREVI